MLQTRWEHLNHLCPVSLQILPDTFRSFFPNDVVALPATLFLPHHFAYCSKSFTFSSSRTRDNESGVGGSSLDLPREVESGTKLTHEPMDGEQLLFSLNNLPKDVVLFRQGLKEQKTDFFIRNISTVSSQITGIIGHFGKGVASGFRAGDQALTP